MMPRDLSDLVPAYVPSVPRSGAWVAYDVETLSVHADLPHTGIYYRFRKDGEGWYVGGYFGNGPLPVPKPAATRPALAGDALIAARVAEYDRRIASGGKPQAEYAAKIGYLLSQGRRDDAL